MGELKIETQKILVTGGAGFIRTNLVNELNNRGREVTALDLYNTERDNYIRAYVKKTTGKLKESLKTILLIMFTI
jgi:nucleoside-diphosphate-sugar epimerase